MRYELATVLTGADLEFWNGGTGRAPKARVSRRHRRRGTRRRRLRGGEGFGEEGFLAENSAFWRLL